MELEPGYLTTLYSRDDCRRQEEEEELRAVRLL